MIIHIEVEVERIGGPAVAPYAIADEYLNIMVDADSVHVDDSEYKVVAANYCGAAPRRPLRGLTSKARTDTRLGDLD